MHGLKRLDAEEESISVPVHMAIKIIQTKHKMKK